MRILHPVIPKFVAPQAIMDPVGFRSDIVQFAGGEPNVRWEIAMPCPCSARATFSGVEGEVGGEPQGGCPKCGNIGTYWVRQPDTFAIVTSGENNPRHREKVTGEGWADGSVRFTCLPENAFGKNDRVTLLHAWIRVTEKRIRRRTLEALRFPLEAREIVSASPSDPRQAILTRESVIEIAWADRTGAFQRVLVEGEDFRVIDTMLDWSPGDRLDLPEEERPAARTAPEVGAQYVVTYWAHPRYVVDAIPFVHRPAATRRPRQVDAEGVPAPTDMPVLVTATLETVGDRQTSTF